MTITSVPVDSGLDLAAPERKKAKRGSLEVRRGGWFVRITILIVVLLWLIPAVGVLVTSFRPEALADSSGWWTAFSHPFSSGQWTLENYRLALDTGGFDNALLNSLAVAIPSTVIRSPSRRSRHTRSRGWTSAVGTSCSCSSSG